MFCSFFFFFFLLFSFLFFSSGTKKPDSPPPPSPRSLSLEPDKCRQVQTSADTCVCAFAVASFFHTAECVFFVRLVLQNAVCGGVCVCVGGAGGDQMRNLWSCFVWIMRLTVWAVPDSLVQRLTLQLIPFDPNAFLEGSSALRREMSA